MSGYIFRLYALVRGIDQSRLCFMPHDDQLPVSDNRRLGTRISLDTMRLDWRFNYQLTLNA